MPPLPTSRVVQWKELEVKVNEIPREGVPQGEPHECDSSYALVYAGHGVTNGAGYWTVSLPAISCLAPAPGGDHQPSVVATPTTEADTDDIPRPYVLAVRTDGNRVTVWSFNLHGAPAPDVEFSWHIIVEGTLVKD